METLMMETLMNPWIGSTIVMVSLAVLLWTLRAPGRPKGPPGRRAATVASPAATPKPRPRPEPRPLPESIAKDVSLERWRNRAIDAEIRAHDAEIELAEARRGMELLARQLRLSPSADRLVVWLDVNGGSAPIGTVARVLGLDRSATEQKVTALARLDQPIELDHDRVRLKAVS